MHARFLLALFFVLPFALEQEAPPSAGKPVLLGSGDHTYRWVSGWGEFQKEPMGNTHGCIVIDSQGKIYFNRDTEEAVTIVSPEGKKIGSWGKDFHNGLHSTVVVKPGGKESLLLGHTRRGEAVLTSLDGEVIWTIPWPEKSQKYKKAEEFRPTTVAMAADGAVFVADGYGKSWIHKFDKDRNYLMSFGGAGPNPDQLQSPHGMIIDTVDGKETLLVCDREKHRLVRYDLDGKILKTYEGDLRRPSNIARLGDLYAIADLAGRVTLLQGPEMKLVCHLGDQPNEQKRAQNGIPRAEWKDGEFFSPHAVAFDKDGNLYVEEWLNTGRIVKLERVKR